MIEGAIDAMVEEFLKEIENDILVEQEKIRGEKYD